MKLYRSSRAARTLACGALILFVFAPIVWILVRSLENPVRTQVTDIPGFLDCYLSFAQYEAVLFHHRAFWAAWWNTLILAVPILLLAAAVASLAAYGAVSLRPQSKKWVYGGYVLFSMLPLQMLLVPNYIVLHGMGLVGTRLAVIFIAVFSPYYPDQAGDAGSRPDGGGGRAQDLFHYRPAADQAGDLHLFPHLRH